MKNLDLFGELIAEMCEFYAQYGRFQTFFRGGVFFDEREVFFSNDSYTIVLCSEWGYVEVLGCTKAEEHFLKKMFKDWLY